MKNKWFGWLMFVTSMMVIAVNCGPSSDSVPSENLGTASQAITCVTFQRGTLGTVADTTVESAAGYNTYAEGTSPTLATGKTAGTRARTLVRFDLSSIPAGSTINSATATLNVNSASAGTINVHRITSAWVEATATWNNFAAAYDTTVVTSFTFSAGTYANKTFTATSLVQSWVDGTNPNNGYLLEQDTATTKTGYRSSEDGTVTSRPALAVCYTAPTGTTSSTAAGSGGSSSSSTTSSTVASTTAATTAASTTASSTSSTSGGGSGSTTSSTTAATTSSTTAGAGGGTSVTTIAVIGDYGAEGSGLTTVAAMVAGWNPDHVLTTGDNVYSSAVDPYATIVGVNYGSFITSNLSTNRFWPIPGNHDWDHTTLTYYLAFFTLPTNGNSERYYHHFLDSAQKIHHFALDADDREPDGNAYTSTQGTWLQAAMAADTTSCFKIVAEHEPSHCSTIGASEGADVIMDWPYATWGADVVLSGSRHGFERLSVSGIPYIVNGLGGGGLYGNWNIIDSHSVYRFPTTPQRYGAQKITVTIGGGVGTMVLEFYGVGDTTPADTFTITKTCN